MVLWGDGFGHLSRAGGVLDAMDEGIDRGNRVSIRASIAWGGAMGAMDPGIDRGAGAQRAMDLGIDRGNPVWIRASIA